MSGRRRPARAELEGFLAGLAHALASRRGEGAPFEVGEARIAAAREAIRSGRLGEAETMLLDVDRQLRGRTPERELTEYPRGLVSYTPTDGAESPTPPEEDPIRNRLLLLQRLAGVRSSQGRQTEPVAQLLREAESALAAGDRRRAKRLGDEAHAALDALEPGREAVAPSRRRREP